MISTSYVATNNGNNRTSNDDIHYRNDSLGLYIVCDGSQKGKWVAEAAINQISYYVQKHEELLISYRRHSTSEQKSKLMQLLKSAVRIACDYVITEKKKRGISEDDKDEISTLEALLVCGDSAMLSHIGNSRTYYLTSKKVSQITEDENYFHKLGINNNPQATLGGELKLGKSLSNAIGLEKVAVNATSFLLNENEFFLLCTDGLMEGYDHNSQEFQKTFASIINKPPLDTVPNRLVSEALKKRSKDNITAMLVTITKDRDQTGLIEVPKGTELAALIETPLFSAFDLQNPFTLKIHGITARKRLNAGQVLIEQGSKVLHLFVVTRGHFNVYIKGIMLKSIRIGKGGLVGEIEFFSTENARATVMASEESDVLVFHKESLDSFIKQYPAQGVKILFGLAESTNKKLGQVTQERYELEEQLEALKSKITEK